MAQYVILIFYKEDSGSVNGDQDRKPVPLTRLSSGRRLNIVLPTAFVSEVVPMVFRRTEIQLSRNGTCGLVFSSSHSTHLARFASPTVFGRVSPPPYSDVTRRVPPLVRDGEELLCHLPTTPSISLWVTRSTCGTRCESTRKRGGKP